MKEESEKVGLKLSIKAVSFQCMTKFTTNKKKKKEKKKLSIKKTMIMTSGSITLWQIDGETMEIVTDLILGEGAPKSLQMVTTDMKLKDVCSLEEKL